MKTSTKVAFNKWAQLKKDHADRILLFSLGNYYETYGKDAEILSNVLLHTDRCTMGSEGKVFGFRASEINDVLTSLIKAGYKAGVCEFNEFI